MPGFMGGKGKGNGSKGGGTSSGGGTDPLRTQMLKPETAPTFNGRGYDQWLKNLEEWESLHYAVDEYQKPGLLMRGLQGEALALARAELRARGLDTTHGDDNGLCVSVSTASLARRLT